MTSSTGMTPDLDSATREAPRRLVILGSTGSIGTQALDVVSEAAGLRRPVSDAAHPPFEVVALAAGNLARQGPSRGWSGALIAALAVFTLLDVRVLRGLRALRESAARQ